MDHPSIKSWETWKLFSSPKNGINVEPGKKIYTTKQMWNAELRLNELCTIYRGKPVSHGQLLEPYELQQHPPWPPPKGKPTYASAGILFYNKHGVLLTHENGKFTTFRGKKDPPDTDYFMTAEREFLEENSPTNNRINTSIRFNVQPLLRNALTKVVFFRNQPNPPYSVIFFVPMDLIGNAYELDSTTSTSSPLEINSSEIDFVQFYTFSDLKGLNIAGDVQKYIDVLQKDLSVSSVPSSVSSNVPSSSSSNVPSLSSNVPSSNVPSSSIGPVRKPKSQPKRYSPIGPPSLIIKVVANPNLNYTQLRENPQVDSTFSTNEVLNDENVTIVRTESGFSYIKDKGWIQTKYLRDYDIHDKF